MRNAQPNVFLGRDDTFFGVCEALGEDLRINANLLRLGFALATFFSPLGAIAAYAGAGLLVALTRLIAPAPGARAAAKAAYATDETTPVQAQEEPAPLPLAA